jgi:hypothetical protein
MAKDKTQGMQRLDLRVPDHIYSQIERIAIANNLPYSPTTKPNADGSLKKDKDGNLIQPKVSVSPIIIDLINLGLKAIKEGTADKSELGDKTRHIEYQINNQIDVSDIEKKIIDTLTQKIEGIVSDELHKSIKTSTEIKDTLEAMIETKVKEVFEVFSLKELGQITDIESDLNSDSSDNFTEAIKEVFSIEDFEPIDTSNEELNNIKVAVAVDKALELADNCEVKSFDEAVIEINRLKKEGLGNTAIAKELTGKYLTKGGKTNWNHTQVRRILNS